MNYLPGTFGYEAHGRRLRIFEAYIEARNAARSGLLEAEEAMSTSDFPTYISKFLRHSFLARFNEIVGEWGRYTRDFSVDDFESYTSSRFGRFTDIPKKPLNGPYEELAIKEFGGPTVQLEEYGASFALTRQLIISDRLNEMAALPNLFAEAMARTISKAAVTALQGNGLMYDGNALFSAAHLNIGTTALTADTDGADAIKAADQALDEQTDDEGYQIVSPNGRTLLAPPELKWVVRALQNNPQIPEFGGQLVPNQVQGFIDEVIIDPYFTDANNWYLSADLTGTGAFMVQVTLNGNRTPFLGLKNPEVRGILGGDDPYSFDFDEIAYKIRHDFAFKLVEWRFIYGSIVA